MNIGLVLAGEKFSLEGVGEREIEKYEAFLTSGGEEDIHVVFTDREAGEIDRGEERKRLDGERLFLAYRDFSIEIDPKQKEAIVRGHYSPYLVENALRILTGYTLSRRERGFLLHAAAIVEDGWAYLFYGRSGSGKTTWARMHAAKQLLSDEIVAVCRGEDNIFVCYSTPFWGEFQRCPVNVQAEIKQGLHLEGKGAFRLSRYSIGDALFTLFPCVIAYGWTLTFPLLGLVEDFARRIPCYAFSFVKKQTDFQSIRVENVVHC